MEHVLPILGLGLLCGAWVYLQRFVAERDPEQPGVEGGCTNCGGAKLRGADGPGEPRPCGEGTPQGGCTTACASASSCNPARA